jgi:glycosidase
MGFTAVWISPVVENEEDGYHGYYTLNHDSELHLQPLPNDNSP